MNDEAKIDVRHLRLSGHDPAENPWIPTYEQYSIRQWRCNEEKSLSDRAINKLESKFAKEYDELYGSPEQQALIARQLGRLKPPKRYSINPSAIRKRNYRDKLKNDDYEAYKANLKADKLMKRAKRAINKPDKTGSELISKKQMRLDRKRALAAQRFQRFREKKENMTSTTLTS